MIVDRFVDVDDSSHRCWLHSNAIESMLFRSIPSFCDCSLGLTFDDGS